MAAAKDVRTVKVDKAQCVNYWHKAEEFLEMANESLTRKNWNATALNSVHAAISAKDALLVYYHGVRSISPRHDDSLRLLLSLVEGEDARRSAAHLRSLIAKKNLVEYEARLFFKSEAEELTKHARRFLSWVRSLLP